MPTDLRLSSVSHLSKRTLVVAGRNGKTPLHRKKLTLPATSSLVERGKKKADGPTPGLFGLRDPLQHLKNESIVLSITALLLINTLGSAALL
jgi:hypothetical protein